MKIQNKGFTLIELLVVVAIIGILASVVLASLNSARNKGKDAAIQSELSNSRGQAELYYSTNGSYGTGYTAAGGMGVVAGVDITPASPACSANNAAAQGMFAAAASSSGLQNLIFGACAAGATSITVTENAATATAWAMKANGVSANTGFCVDSTGTSKTYSALPIASFTAGFACP